MKLNKIIPYVPLVGMIVILYNGPSNIKYIPTNDRWVAISAIIQALSFVTALIGITMLR